MSPTKGEQGCGSNIGGSKFKGAIGGFGKASTQGAIFALTGGDHFYPDDMVKVAEMPIKKA